MSNNFIDYSHMLDEYLNLPMREKVKTTTRIARESDMIINRRNSSDNDEIVIGRDIVEINENNKMSELQSLINETAARKKLDFNSSYILGIDETGLKFAQYSDNYIFDDLMNINAFLSKEHRKFDKNLKYVYFIDEKHKFKYIQKAQKKNKYCLYNDDSFGTRILDYINGQQKHILGDKYGVQNCILDNITRSDNISKKFIIILSFDVDMFEIYYSIPYNMYEKGSVLLEDELVYACRLDEIDPNAILTYLDENSEYYM